MLIYQNDCKPSIQECTYIKRRHYLLIFVTSIILMLIARKCLVVRSVLDGYMEYNQNEVDSGFLSNTIMDHSLSVTWGAGEGHWKNLPSALNLLHEVPLQYYCRNGNESRQDGTEIRILGETDLTFHSRDIDSIVVTAYYEIPSKHSPSHYALWMQNFLGKYKDAMVIFTSPDLMPRITRMRCIEEKGDFSAANCFPTVLVGLSLEDLPLGKLYPKFFWVDQLDRDPEGKAHAPLRGDPRMHGRFESGELYWIWLSKVWFVSEAMRILNDYSSPYRESQNRLHGCHGGSFGESYSREPNDDDIFAWIDIGSFRKDSNESYPQKTNRLLLKHTDIVPFDEILFWSHAPRRVMKEKSGDSPHKKQTFAPIAPEASPYFDDKLGHPEWFFHAGAHFVARRRAVLDFYVHFLNTLDVFVQKNLRLADDQAVLQSTCLSYFHQGRNLCAYADRSMANSKWFGLALLLENGPTKAWKRDTTQHLQKSYWRPPPPEYYNDEQVANET